MADIGVFTLIALDNYGALLQSFSLQKQLDKMGYTSEIVDVRSKDQNDCRMILKVRSPLDILRNVRQLLNYTKVRRRFDLFSDFVRENIRLSRNYPDIQSLTEEELPYKLLMTGSDQTFNVKLSVFKEVYYLGFEKKRPKVSYASSFGEFCKSFTAEERKRIKEWLSEYKHISIREEQGVNFAKKITGRSDIVKTVDPTLLIQREDWEELIGDNRNRYGDYLLFYSVLSDKWVVDEVKRIAREYKLKVIVPHLCNQFEIGADFKRVVVSPDGFLNLVKHAKMVLTTSFHATVFSIIFHKPFYSFVPEEGNRIGSLLAMLALEERMIKSAGKDIVQTEIDFVNADRILKAEREKSIEYLSQVLGEI